MENGRSIIFCLLPDIPISPQQSFLFVSLADDEEEASSVAQALSMIRELLSSIDQQVPKYFLTNDSFMCSVERTKQLIQDY